LFVTKTASEYLDQVFEINAEYSGSDCDGKLTSLSVVNAQFPLTWHELDQNGNIIRSDINLPLENLRNNTTYLVEDKTNHTDTVFIQFDRSIRINKIFPNPVVKSTQIEFNTQDELQVSLKLYDLNGKLIALFEDHANPENHKISWDIPELSKGIYLLKIKAHCIDETRKLILLKP
jgi:hypothetical protein